MGSCCCPGRPSSPPYPWTASLPTSASGGLWQGTPLRRLLVTNSLAPQPQLDTLRHHLPSTRGPGGNAPCRITQQGAVVAKEQEEEEEGVRRCRQWWRTQGCRPSPSAASDMPCSKCPGVGAADHRLEILSSDIAFRERVLLDSRYRCQQLLCCPTSFHCPTCLLPCLIQASLHLCVHTKAFRGGGCPPSSVEPVRGCVWQGLFGASVVPQRARSSLGRHGQV